MYEVLFDAANLQALLIGVSSSSEFHGLKASSFRVQAQCSFGATALKATADPRAECRLDGGTGNRHWMEQELVAKDYDG